MGQCQVTWVINRVERAQVNELRLQQYPPAAGTAAQSVTCAAEAGQDC